MTAEDIIGKTFGKDYFVSIVDNRVIISKNPNARLVRYEDMMDITKRYIYKEGDKITTPFGVQTIKSIDRNYGNTDSHGYEWLILVEENSNQYKPCEMIGVFVKEIELNMFNYRLSLEL